ncbi:MAG: ArnT family glycosyltransferase [Bryobacteraceae bacterium]
MPLRKKRRPERLRASTAFLLALAFAALVFLPHVPLLTLPFYWDEAGMFVPAALDLYQFGQWVPHSAVPGAHPPGVPAYLAAGWRITGYSIPATRVLMLALASAGLFIVFLLAIELCRGIEGVPAFSAVLLLGASPLFFAQSMLAQLDMPAMVFTCLALLLYLKDRMFWSGVACLALVMAKETGVILPILLGGALVAERRFRQGAYFALAPVALAAWMLFLGRSTGHVLGSSEFSSFNFDYLLHPVRAATAFGKRLYYLFGADFHWIGAVGLIAAARRGNWREKPRVKLIAMFAGTHIVLMSLLGGAMLERYLLPVLPLVYIGMVAGLSSFPKPWAGIAQFAMIVAMVAGNFWNPPYPFPYENNLAFTDFVDLHATAAEFVEQRYPMAAVATAWPLSAALQRPELGYVHQRLAVRKLQDFGRDLVLALDPSSIDIFILYSRDWEPSYSFMRIEPVRRFWSRFFGYRVSVGRAEIETHFGLKPVGSWARRGQWIEVYARR